MFGNKIVISEKLVAKLIGYDGSGIICEQMVEKEFKLTKISKEIFVSGKHSSKIKDLHHKLRVWDQLLMGCIHHKRLINSSDYINSDQ